MSEAITVIQSTAKKYFAGASDLTLRKRLLLAELQRRGRIVYNENGYDCTWDVEFSQPPVQAHGAGGEYSFSAHDAYRQLTIDWRGYVATDKMDEKERLMNAGDVAIVNRYKRIMPNLLKSLDNNFHSEAYIDGYATGNENRLHGILSFLTEGGTTNAGDILATPNDSYGGRSTVLGALGGSWSSALSTKPNATLATDWPDGNGDSEYDYLSPVIANYTSTGWTGTATWESTCARVLRRVTTWLTKNGGSEGRPDCFFLSSDLFNTYQDYQETKFRILVPHKGADDLGFSDTLNQDGVMVKHEFDVPAGQGFAFNFDMMELASLDDVLFGTRGPHYDIHSDAHLFKAGFFGNMRWQPKYFGKLKAIA